jgi:hypothetical protein
VSFAPSNRTRAQFSLLHATTEFMGFALHSGDNRRGHWHAIRREHGIGEPYTACGGTDCNSGLRPLSKEQALAFFLNKEAHYTVIACFQRTESGKEQFKQHLRKVPPPPSAPPTPASPHMHTTIRAAHCCICRCVWQMRSP